MKGITPFCLCVFLISVLQGCSGQTGNSTSNNPASKTAQGVVGGPFENGDFLYIGMPDQIRSVDTSAGWSQDGQKLLIRGTIYKADGRTPAPDVILYYYHTDINGYYPDREGLDPRVVRHGYIRGWVKSDEKGKYAIFTVRPAPYPQSDSPAHIHPAIKEPGIDKEYYIDEFVFDDDVLLTQSKRDALENRGGSGILKVSLQGDLAVAEHDILLGLNIPNYPGR
jgi:protocatechuate 3,4-dioxygenase beta subunit